MKLQMTQIKLVVWNSRIYTYIWITWNLIKFKYVWLTKHVIRTSPEFPMNFKFPNKQLAYLASDPQPTTVQQ